MVAAPDAILFVVLVKFSSAQLKTWLTMVRELIHDCVPWIGADYIEGTSPLPLIPTISGSLKKCAYGACSDQFTFLQHFYLRKQVLQIITQRERPLPTAHYILPDEVAEWNKIKGMTDTFSRVMKNVKPDLHSLHPYAFCMIRMLNFMLYDAHLLFRIFQLEHKLDTFTTLERLRDALNHVGSFKDSLYTIIGSLKFTHRELTGGLSSQQPSAAAAMPHPTPATTTTKRGTLTSKSRNPKKLEFLNSDAGRSLRMTGTHIPMTGKQMYCLLCMSHTLKFCPTCSDVENGIFFACCTTDSLPASGRASTVQTCCFQRMHENTKLRQAKPGSKKKRKSDQQAEAMTANAGVARASKVRLSNASSGYGDDDEHDEEGEEGGEDGMEE